MMLSIGWSMDGTVSAAAAGAAAAAAAVDVVL